MIEIIYKGEEEECETKLDIELPVNIRQIGDCEFQRQKIYVEDFVMSFIKHFHERDLKYGVLLGNVKKGNGHSYLFLRGAVLAKNRIDTEITFDEEVWSHIYEDIKTYFSQVEILGWFASVPSLLKDDMVKMQKIHLDHFAGNHKVCILIDRMEGEENFYSYGEHGLVEEPGFYVYYEKNPEMKEYMATMPEERYQQMEDAVIRVRNGQAVGKIRVKGKGGEKGKERKGLMEHLPVFTYSVSSFMLIAVLIGAVAMMKASGQLSDLKHVIGNFTYKEKETSISEQEAVGQPSLSIIDVSGNVSKITESQDAQTGTQAQNGATSQPLTEAQTGASETKSQEQTLESESQTQAQPGESEPQTQSQAVGSEPSTQAQAVGTESVSPNPGESETKPQPVQEPAPAASQPQPAPESQSASLSEPQREPYFYKVKKGDSLYKISLEQYGSIAQIQKIMEANQLTNGSLIIEGQVLVLP